MKIHSLIVQVFYEDDSKIDKYFEGESSTRGHFGSEHLTKYLIELSDLSIIWQPQLNPNLAPLRQTPSRQRRNLSSTSSGQWTRSWCGHVICVARWPPNIRECTTRRFRKPSDCNGEFCPRKRRYLISRRRSDFKQSTAFDIPITNTNPADESRNRSRKTRDFHSPFHRLPTTEP